MQLLQNHNLKHLNTFGINVSAKYFVECNSLPDIEEVINNSLYSKEQLLILGGGSNILFTQNFDGLILKNNLLGIELIKEDDTFYYVKSAAGEIWHDFVMYCINNNYAGLENLSLIPGCVGASPMQNIGAYGVEIKDYFHELEAYHIQERRIQKFNNNDCKFGYRESIFKREFKNQFIILSVTFRLLKKTVFNTSYGAIETELQSMGVSTLTIKAISQAVCNIRNSKLPNPKEIGNAGSFFKNPEISKNKFGFLKSKYPTIVGYSLENKNVKIAAGWLIEQCGWKGKSFGDAGVHKNQALVLVNYNNATGKEIYDLSEKIIDSVLNKFGITLEREVNII